MRERLSLLLRYLGFWLALFLAAKAVFLCYQYRESARLAWGTIAGVFWHGFPMDLSSASYLTVVPGLLIALSTFVQPRLVRTLLAVVTTVEVMVVLLLVTIDLETFRAWGVRLDSTPLVYMQTPREMWASAGASPLLLLFTLLSVLTACSLLIARRFLLTPMERLTGHGAGTFIGSFAVTLLLIIPIRGGVQQIPLNQSTVYFSTVRFANQAALNVGWNFFNSIDRQAQPRTNPYRAYPSDQVGPMIRRVFAGGSERVRLLRSERPNIFLIIWESFNPKVVTNQGGLPAITPTFESAIHEGVLFDHFYASGDRTEKGLVAILSGFPAQPRGSITEFPSKTEQLPFLSRDLARHGYATAFYYGGELEFANLGTYLVNGGFAPLVGKQEFRREDWNSKWGAHDHVVFRRALDDAARERLPWFKVVLTLSSHEPFEVPGDPGPPAKNEQTRFLNAMRYTDRSLGAFLAEARRAPWWNNTLIVILADHGHRLPDIHPGEQASDAERFRIPMLWLGGALIPRDTVVHDIGGQTDLPPTLLGQLGISNVAYAWGRDLFRRPASHIAFFTFHDGFGFIGDRGSIVYDNAGNQVVSQTGTADTLELRLGKSLQQSAFQAYLDK